MPIDLEVLVVALAVSAGALLCSHPPIMPSVNAADVIAGLEHVLSMPPCVEEFMDTCMLTVATP
jgi:hypothetical protein